MMYSSHSAGRIELKSYLFFWVGGFLALDYILHLYQENNLGSIHRPTRPASRKDLESQ